MRLYLCALLWTNPDEASQYADGQRQLENREPRDRPETPGGATHTSGFTKQKYAPFYKKLKLFQVENTPYCSWNNLWSEDQGLKGFLNHE